MIGWPATVRIFVAVASADLRKGFDGLAQLAREVIVGVSLGLVPQPSKGTGGGPPLQAQANLQKG
jgi:hypothetical protein